MLLSKMSSAASNVKSVAARPATARPAASASAVPAQRPVSAAPAVPAVPATLPPVDSEEFNLAPVTDAAILEKAKGVVHVPTAKTMEYAARISMVLDKPILLDYYEDSHNRKAFMGTSGSSSETILIKNKTEYTSPISRKFAIGQDRIVVTENSIYIVAANIATAKFNG
jgi:hypothetical protein